MKPPVYLRGITKAINLFPTFRGVSLSSLRSFEKYSTIGARVFGVIGTGLEVIKAIHDFNRDGSIKASKLVDLGAKVLLTALLFVPGIGEVVGGAILIYEGIRLIAGKKIDKFIDDHLRPFTKKDWNNLKQKAAKVGHAIYTTVKNVITAPIRAAVEIGRRIANSPVGQAVKHVIKDIKTGISNAIGSAKSFLFNLSFRG